jgi:hypothetical protein
VRYVFYWVGISLSLAERRWEDEKLWLFEPLAHNLPRERRRGSDFFIFLTRNPFKRLDSEKKMKGNESKFTSV